MKKTSILLSLLLIALSSCGNPGSGPTLSDREGPYGGDEDRQHRDHDRRDRGDDDDGDDEDRHVWWN